MTPDLRRNPLNGAPVLIVPGRASRPGATGRTTRVGAARTCPFCEGHERETPPEVEVDLDAREGREHDTPGWRVRVVPNKYPAIPGHEVVVHGPDHLVALADASPDLVEEVVFMWGRRREAHRLAGDAYLLAGLNEGAGAGASLEHSHSQLVPFGEIPPAVAAEAAALAQPCALCAELERLDGTTIRREDGLVTFAAPWGRSPYETWIAPETHTGVVGDDAAALGRALLDVARRYRSVLGDGLSWNAILHDAPLPGGDWHWHLETLPRITVPALVELGSGLWINTVDPAEAADHLRSVTPFP
jgi:UDPglucose--hexose-1-phosphate uridylyltransferase